jgi:hypothetical protein
MLSEVVLQHIDKAGEKGTKTRYFRYVDDIKIFAKSEDELRRKIVALDLASKEIGLFPQTAKINIRRIDNPDDEIKSVSRPPEPSVRPIVDQKRLVRRLLEITRRSRIDPLLSSRFKFLLARADPSYRLSQRLLLVVRQHPEHSGIIASYFSRYDAISAQLGAKIIEYVREPELYQSVSGDILRGCLGRMPPAEADILARFASDRLLRPKRGLLPLQPTYKEALIAWTIRARQITYSELENLRDNETDWWVRKCILRELTATQFGVPSYKDFLNKSIRITEGEIARCAAARLVEEVIPVDKPYSDVFEAAKLILKAAKMIRSIGKPPSMINSILAYVLSRPETQYDWIAFFGTEHRHAEQMAIFLKQSRETDIDAFMTRFDSFADKIVEVTFSHYCPGKKYPAYGSALANPTLIALLPRTMKTFSDLHQLRLASITAHPRSLKTGTGTRRLRHSDFVRVRPSLEAAFDEFEQFCVPKVRMAA